MSEIKELCINTLISFGMSCTIAKTVVSELLYESAKRNSEKTATYMDVFEVLGKFPHPEIEAIRHAFQTIQEDGEDDTDAILFMIDVYTKYCLMSED